MKKLLTALIILTMLVCTFSAVAFAEDATIYVNGTSYDGTLKAALEGASKTETTTIELKGDVTIDGVVNIPADTDVVLDLGGYKVTTSSIIYPKGKLLIKNGTYEDSTTSYGITMTGYEGAHLILDDVTINSTSPSGAITLGDTNTYTAYVSIYDGTVINTVMNVIYDCADLTVVNIYGGTFTSSATSGRILKGDAAFNIYGGTFSNSTTNIGSGAFNSINSSRTKMYGGTFPFSPSWISTDCAVTQSGSVYTVAPKDATFTVASKGITTSWLGAMKAVEDNDTVTLADDATIDYALKVSDVNKKFTFDLGGNTLTSTALITTGNTGAIFWLYDSSDVTIVNGTMQSNVITTADAENPSAIMQGTAWGDDTTTSTLTLGGDGNSLKISAGPSTNLIASDAENGKLVVNDGVTLEVISGAISSNNIYAMGEVVINGGTFENNGTGSPTSGFINNLKITGHDTATVKISGGTFNNDIELERNGSLIELTGGKYYGIIFNDTNYVKDKIYDCQTFTADGYYANNYNYNSESYVQVENTTAALLNGKYYPSVDMACNAAIDGDLITLMADFDSSATIDKAIAIVKNGYTMDMALVDIAGAYDLEETDEAYIITAKPPITIEEKLSIKSGFSVNNGEYKTWRPVVPIDSLDYAAVGIDFEITTQAGDTYTWNVEATEVYEKIVMGDSSTSASTLATANDLSIKYIFTAALGEIPMDEWNNATSKTVTAYVIDFEGNKISGTPMNW